MPGHSSSSPPSPTPASTTTTTTTTTGSKNIFCEIFHLSTGVCDTALTSSSGDDEVSALNNIFIEQREKSVTSPCK